MIRSTTAAVFHGPGQPLELLDVPVPSLAPGEVLVKVTLCTICGSDLHTFTGRRSCKTPIVLGHEITGRVLEINGTATDFSGRKLQPGDRVTWSIAASCGDCFYCSRTIPQKCEQLAKYGHEPISTHGAVGGLAEHCRILSGTAIFHVPDSLSDTAVCPAGCCTATAAAALRTAGPLDGASIAIMGAGSLGLSAAAMAVHQAAGDVFLADVNESRLRRAHQLSGCFPVCVGADRDRDPLRTLITERTHGRGVDLVLEMTGATDAAESGIELLRTGGRLILVGAVFPGRSLELSAEQAVRRLLRIEGVHNYRPDDLQTAISFLAAAPADSPAGNLVEQEFRLTEVNQAFQSALENSPLRVSVRP
ncbi:MAG: alcohol dehydrogenase catalytic domain-containing protein [Planctomycetaceae bacterium]